MRSQLQALDGSTMAPTHQQSDQREPATSPSDDQLRSLCARLARGDMSTLGTLYDALARELFAFALWSCGRPDHAEDLVQEVFVRLVSSASLVAKARRPRAYIFKMIHRLVLDAARRARPEETIDDLLLAPTEAGQEQLAYARQVSAHVAALPLAQRQALLLREILGLSFREIAEATGTRLFTAASRHRLALSTLRRRLGATTSKPRNDRGTER